MNPSTKKIHKVVYPKETPASRFYRPAGFAQSDFVLGHVFSFCFLGFLLATPSCLSAVDDELDDALHEKTVWHLIERVLIQRPLLEDRAVVGEVLGGLNRGVCLFIIFIDGLRLSRCFGDRLFCFFFSKFGRFLDGMFVIVLSLG